MGLQLGWMGSGEEAAEGNVVKGMAVEGENCTERGNMEMRMALWKHGFGFSAALYLH
jgi:hypothetical protein